MTSTGAPTPQAQLGAAVTVLDTSDYQGTRDMQEGLRFVPGLQATETGQAGGTTSVFIRGGGSDANKVLIDGIPMNDIGGSVEFANIASAAVAHVEVLRGPNSVLYGSDALAGVISLTTARGSTPLPLFTYLLDGGNLGTYRQEGTVGGRYQAVRLFLRLLALRQQQCDCRRRVSQRHVCGKLRLGTFPGVQPSRHDPS